MSVAISQLGALLEESVPGGAARAAGPSTLDVSDDSEPIPTLASLLLSTAESLRKVKGPAVNGRGYSSSNSTNALLSSSSSTTYLSTLLSLPLPTIQSLPASLSTLSATLDTDLSSLAFTRYSSFLLSHSATQSISSSFKTLSTSLDSLLESTSSLESAASKFESRVKVVREKRERMARVKDRMEEVEELLEASNVVEACVRAGYWSEAIDVAVRLGDLHGRLEAGSNLHGKGALVLIDRVREQVSLALLSLRARVLDTLLYRGLKLPAAVRAIAILRRMSEGGLGLEESGSELREDGLWVVLLAARWRCLRGELEVVEGQMMASGIKFSTTAAADGSNGTAAETAASLRKAHEEVGAEENEGRTRWTKKWIEIWREVIGETIGMYNEVFLPSSSSSAALDTDTDPETPLMLFLSSALSHLSLVLSSALPSLTSTASLSSLLTQLSYCSHSFGRFGLEFRAFTQITQLVELRVGEIVRRDWEIAGRRFETDWREGWEGKVPSSSSSGRRKSTTVLKHATLESWLTTPESLSSILSSPLPPSPSTTPWSPLPNPTLSLLPPLARFLNAHSNALNSLRLLPSIILLPSLLSAQSSELDRATQVIAAFIDAWLPSHQRRLDALLASPDEVGVGESEEVRREEELVEWVVRAWGREVVPWIEGALREGVYGDLEGDEKEGKVGEAKERCEGILRRLEGGEIEEDGKEEEVKEVLEVEPMQVKEVVVEETIEEQPEELVEQVVEEEVVLVTAPDPNDIPTDPDVPIVTEEVIEDVKEKEKETAAEVPSVEKVDVVETPPTPAIDA